VATTDLIIIRLHPTNPESASDFRTDLAGLTIEAYDLMVDDTSPGEPVGTASGLAAAAPANNAINIANKQIMQHYMAVTVGAVTTNYLEAAATAVIIANPPAGHTEYPAADSFDLRLVIKRNGAAVTDDVIDYNVLAVQVTGPLSKSQQSYQQLTASTYVAIPPAPPAGSTAPALTLPSDGTPPAFDALVSAIDAVLALDPSGASLEGYAAQPGQLSVATCQQIAAEIIWNRSYDPPPSEPVSSTAVGFMDYGITYTNPQPGAPDLASQQDMDTARQQFEANWKSYYATNMADVTQLMSYVYTAWAAVICEYMSTQASSAGFAFPILTSNEPAIDTGVVLTSSPAGNALDPGFGVPAAYFYALATALPTQIPPSQRYDLARYSPESKTLLDLTNAQTASIITSDEAFTTDPGRTLNLNQAARRLDSLGSASSSLPSVALTGAAISQLVSDWLNYAGATTTIDTAFWPGEVTAHEADYLQLVMEVVTDNDPVLPNLLTAIGNAPLNVTTVAGLALVTDQQWRNFFTPPGAVPQLALLPQFTEPGTPAERVEAFIRHLQNFFTVPTELIPGQSAAAGTPNSLGTPTGDVLALFSSNYETAAGAPWTAGAALDQAAAATAVAQTLPGDDVAQAWLTQAVDTIGVLYAVVSSAGVGAADELQFSLMEALYARGFTDDESIQRLTAEQFQAALTGTVAYPYASSIQEAAGGSTASPSTGGGGFNPVNPNGSLINCVPPPYLSPFGPVAYLAQLLKAGAASTCGQPEDPDPTAQLGALVANRRGPLDELHATEANLETPLPAIDFVNESLEELAAAVAPGGSATIGGAVFDTPATALAGHKLSDGEHPGGHDAATLFAAIPAFSSPATVDVPAASTAAYAALRADFSASCLPYDQPIDISRSYLRRLCTTRFATMRRFRKEITEFVLDPAPGDEPAGFDRYAWRYPVRTDIAIEYLCLTPEEYQQLFSQRVSITADDGADDGGDDALTLWSLYGYPSPEDGDEPWTETVLAVPQFLRRTGLDYCDLVELQRCGPVPFTVTQVSQTPVSAPPAGPADAPLADAIAAVPPAGGDGNGGSAGGGPTGALPACEPCCPDNLRIVFGDGGRQTATVALYELIVFIRLWRRVGEATCHRLTICQLTDISAVLGLFADGSVNPDFVRQLAALLMLCEDFGVPLAPPDDAAPMSGAGGAVAQTPEDRIPLLALWAQPPVANWGEAVRLLLAGVDRHAIGRYGCGSRQAEFAKLTDVELDPLSALAGFDPLTTSDTWHAAPTHTLRFAEVLGKLYASAFTVGEIVFMFTVEDHLDGDDPFQLADAEESGDDPLALPDSERHAAHSLWALRRALLEVEVDDDAAREWSWKQIVALLRDEFGYSPQAGADPLAELGDRFFPEAVERSGQPVNLTQRQFRTSLSSADTDPAMWTAQRGPFAYDSTAQQLVAWLPLWDAELIERLAELRPLNTAEQLAVRELYFAPRGALAPFAALFDDFGAAAARLIEEPDEDERFGFFQREVARFHRRCTVIAEHLAKHVDAVAGERCPEHERGGGFAVAWRVLRGMLADGNLALGPWESDSGQPPQTTWGPQPSGGAFAGLLGLTGTGLLGEYHTGGELVWRETRGSLRAFGGARDARNAPIPTVLPAFDAAITPGQARFAGVRNGFALRDRDGELLGGAEPFRVSWSGVLLIEQRGRYRFRASRPAHDHGGHADDRQAACDERRRVTLGRGQKTWVLLDGDDAPAQSPDHESEPVDLRRGAYRITVEFEQSAPAYEGPEQVHPTRTGIEVAYCGTDTDDRFEVIDSCRLFRDTVDASLGSGLVAQPGDGEPGGGFLPGQSAAQYLNGQYGSSLRDIRRTYQRAFKTALFARLFRLSAEWVTGYRQSELGYLLDNAETFAGTAYPRTGATTFDSHHAWFDPDLWPVSDPYPPGPGADQRAAPSPQRQAALFDGWERVFDYSRLRADTRHARERPAWLLFAEVAEDQPDPAAELLRHLGVDLGLAPLVLTYFDTPDEYTLGGMDLADERWAVRVWEADSWLRRLLEHFHPASIGDARPDLWAATDPGAAIGAVPVSGNANLTAFVQDGYFENGAPHRYDAIRQLNDALRERARCALLAYLCAMHRVPLPGGSGTYVTAPRELSDLLLQDVEAGLGQRLSRIEDAVRATQAFVQRARLGLEAPTFTVTVSFARLWDRRFATFRTWEACQRREWYTENWIAWDELHEARRVEAFRHLEDELRRSTLSIAAPGGVTWWPDAGLPPHPTLRLAQDSEPVEDQLLQPAIEGLGLFAQPERAARPAWLAPVPGASSSVPGAGPGPSQPVAQDRAADDVPAADAAPADAVSSAPAADAPLPLWLESAVRLGTDFVRVAAAGVPPASAHFEPHGGHAPCCADCDEQDPPLVDEYYFWLEDSSYFDAVLGTIDYDEDSNAPPTQNADAGVPATSPGSNPTDETSYWEQPDKLPSMLQWNPQPMVHLCWSRVHHGEFDPPRRDSTGLLVESGTVPVLRFTGRTGDSLRFEVSGGQAPTGYTDPTAPGFRYDIADDSAVPLPLVVAPPAPVASTLPGGLTTYPFFVYVGPGAPIEPLSPYGVAFAVGGALHAHCQFEAALKWYGLAYAPLGSDNAWALCASASGGSAAAEPDGVAATGTATGTDTVTGTAVPVHADAAAPPSSVALPTGPRDAPCCPAAPADAPRARDRALLLAYLEVLSRWAETLLCRNTPESAQQAEVVLSALRQILGTRPVTVLSQGDAGSPATIAGFEPLPAPLNPRLLALYERTAERLELIRADDDGRRLRSVRGRDEQAFWGASRLRDGWRETSGPCQGDPCEDVGCDHDEALCCCGPYRFSFLVQRALEITGDVRTLAGSLLSAYEKNDGEALAALRAAHERQLAELALTVRQYAWREADWQVQALGTSKQGAQARLRYYQQLLQNGLNAGETSYVALTGAAAAARTAATVTEAIGQGMTVTPDIAVGVAGLGPYEATQLPIGSKLAGNFAAAARIMNTVGDIAGTGAGLSLTQGGWDRRTAEWQLQVTTITIEIEQIQQQILAAERRRDSALRELNDQQQMIEHSIEVQDFLRDKFTNSELYLYLVQETAALHKQMYDLARHAAERAQRAYNYERGHTARRFLPDPGWDDLHEGLTAGERLHLAVRQMEISYEDLNCREYELTKHISLRLDFPLAFLQLQQTGHTEIEIPEWMFDLDYPGHYMRRIKNVTMTIPCVVGPYTGVHCRLTLIDSSTRVDPRLTGPDATCCPLEPGPRDRYDCHLDCAECHREGCGGCGDRGCASGPDRDGRVGGCGCGDCGREGSGYSAHPQDPRFVRIYGATEAIATSSGQNDAGLFELSFRDERYLPFEFAGAISRWRIDLPPDNNRFRFDSLTDVVLHLNYTAREGGEPLRRAANRSARQHLPGAGVRLFDVRYDLPDAWNRLRARIGDADRASLPLVLSRMQFPYITGRCDVFITKIAVIVEVEDACCRDHVPARFVREHELPHGPDEPCECGGHDFTCVADPELPQLFHGVFDLPLGPLGEDPRELGELHLRVDGQRIRKMFLVCGYDTAEPDRGAGARIF
jgi:hypothetical protein